MVSTKRSRVLLSWSSGKDSAWALHTLRRQDDVEVVGLLTTLNQEFDRVAMHAVRRSLLEAQARVAGLPLTCVDLPWPCSNEAYESIMGGVVARADEEGIAFMAFGDLFLEDIRSYREERLAGTRIKPLFPLWLKPTAKLARQMIDSGLVAHVTCLDPKVMPKELAGRRYDHEFLHDLPKGIDPCGENGEFHTFVSAGPMFNDSLDVVVGDIEERDGFVFADLLPRLLS